LDLEGFLFDLVKTKVNTDRQNWEDLKSFNLNKKKHNEKALNLTTKRTRQQHLN